MKEEREENINANNQNNVLAEIPLHCLPRFDYGFFSELKGNFQRKELNSNDGTTSTKTVAYFDVDQHVLTQLIECGVKRVESSTDIYYDTRSFALAKERVWLKNNSKKGYQIKKFVSGNGKSSPIFYQKKIGLTECNVFLKKIFSHSIKDVQAIATFEKTRITCFSGLSLTVIYLDHLHAYRVIGSIKNFTQYSFLEEEFCVKSLRPTESKMIHFMKYKRPDIYHKFLHPIDGKCTLLAYNPVARYNIGQEKIRKKKDQNKENMYTRQDLSTVEDVFQFFSQQ